MDLARRLHENLARVRGNIAAACARRGRDPADVRLVAVTKYVSLDTGRAVVAAGLNDLGENQVQQLVERAVALGRPGFGWEGSAEGATSPAPRWHMLGHLQRNKVKALLRYARIVHSLDSVRLAETLQRHAADQDVGVDVLIEVNVAGEEQKTGLEPQNLEALVEHVAGCDRLRLRGLMTMAPFNPDPEAARPYFARLRELLQKLIARRLAGDQCQHLSMGMSQDYAVGVEEGATLVRIGSALFEGLSGQQAGDR